MEAGEKKKMTKVTKLMHDTMEEMEKRGFTIRETEEFLEWMKAGLERNSERIAKDKPFTIFRDED